MKIKENRKKLLTCIIQENVPEKKNEIIHWKSILLFCFRPRWSNRDWLYPPVWNNLKHWTKCMKQWFQGIGHQVMKDSDSWDRENIWGQPYDCPNLLPCESFQVVAQERKSGRRNLADSLSWEDRVMSPRRPKGAGVSRKKYWERSQKSDEGHVGHSAKYWSVTSKAGKEPHETIGGNNTWCSHRPGTNACKEGGPRQGG